MAGRGDSSRFLAVKNPAHPPDRPPTARLLLQADGGNKVGEQQGLVIHYHWLIDEKVRSFELSPPISWPTGLVATSHHTVILNLGTSIAPARIETWLYRTLGPDGIPEGEPTLLICDLYTELQDNCDLGLPTKRDREDQWELTMPQIAEYGDYYIAVRARWRDFLSNTPEGLGFTYAAAWGFVVKK